MKTFAVVAGYWSTNIGNSFFQLGTKYLLEQLFPDDKVLLLSDQPGYWNVKQGNPANAFILLEHIPIDYLVIQGPFLRPEFDKIWLHTLRKLHAKGVKIVVVSAGMMDYSSAAIKQYRTWLTEIPPFVFTTRDEETYNHIADCAEHAYNGIDVAFFVSDLFKPVALDLEKFVVFNFDKDPEPRVLLNEQYQLKSSPDYVFEFDNQSWVLQFPKLRTYLSRRFKFYPFVDAFLPRPYLTRIGNYQIVRTDHRFNPLLLKKVFKAPRAFVSDLPYSYLNLYANADLVLSNRVHACVAALAYGRSAMLVSKSPRARLLKRVGAQSIKQQPCSIPLQQIEGEKKALIDFLKKVPW